MNHQAESPVDAGKNGKKATFSAGSHIDVPRVVVIGCSGHARVVIDILEQNHSCRIMGLLDTYRHPTTTVLGYQVLGSDDDLRALVDANICDSVFVAIGDNWIRSLVVDRVKRLVPDVRFVTAIHASAQISRNVSVGVGTAIMAGAVVNSGCRIGDFCILNTCSSLDHDSTMEQYSSLAPRAVTGGSVSIGAFSAVAIGAVVSHAIRIGEQTVVGAGATVVNDIPAGVVAYGTPARIIRQRTPGASYLSGRNYEPPTLPVPPPSPAIVHLLKNLAVLSSQAADWAAYLQRAPHDYFHRADFHSMAETLGSGRASLAVYGNSDKFLAWPFIMQDIEDCGGCSAGNLKDITSVYGYTGPIASGCENDQSFLLSAWNAMVDMWRSYGIVSVFARLHPVLANHRLLPHLRSDRVNSHFSYDEFGEGKTVAIDLLPSREETWKSYDRHLRQALHRLLALGTNVTLDPEWKYLDDFIRMYYRTMKRNNASAFYLFPGEYFCKLRETLGSHGSLIIAHCGDQVAAGGLLIEYGGIVHVHLLATDDAFVSLSPSKLIIHEAQAWARARGNRLLHLGGGRASRTDDSLFRFKSMFSDNFYTFYTGRWVVNQGAYELLTLKRENQANKLGFALSTSYFPAYRASFREIVGIGEEGDQTSPHAGLAPVS